MGCWGSDLSLPRLLLLWPHLMYTLIDWAIHILCFLDQCIIAPEDPKTHTEPSPNLHCNVGEFVWSSQHLRRVWWNHGVWAHQTTCLHLGTWGHWTTIYGYKSLRARSHDMDPTKPCSWQEQTNDSSAQSGPADIFHRGQKQKINKYKIPLIHFS